MTTRTFDTTVLGGLPVTIGYEMARIAKNAVECKKISASCYDDYHDSVARASDDA